MVAGGAPDPGCRIREIFVGLESDSHAKSALAKVSSGQFSGSAAIIFDHLPELSASRTFEIESLFRRSQYEIAVFRSLTDS